MEGILSRLVKIRQERLLEYLSSVKNEYESGSLLMTNAPSIISRLKALVSKLESEIKHYASSSSSPNMEMVVSATDLQLEGEDMITTLSESLEVTKKHAVFPSEETFRQITTKLPKLELPKFNGNQLGWIQFWDRFETNVHIQNIADADKLSYLISCLEGVAAETVAGLAITNSNYSIAVDTLRRRFGSPDILIDAHYSALNNLPKANSDAMSCRSTLDEVERHLRVLAKLGEPSDGNHFRAVILSKFPEKIVHEYHLTSTNDNSMSAIRTGLHNIITAMEKSSYLSIPESLPGSSGLAITTEALHVKDERRQPTLRYKPGRFIKQQPNHYNKRKAEQNTPGPPNKKSRLPCIFCNLNNHSSINCRKFKTVEDRKGKLEGRCLNCLRRNHKTEQCNRKLTCFRCKGLHMQMLCPEQKGEKQNHITLKNSTECILHVPDNCCTTFLQVAVTQIKNPSNTKQKRCRLILDSGSQRSYLTEKAASALGLCTEKRDLLLVYTFGSGTPKEISSPSTNIIIETKRGIKRQIKVNIVPHITDSLPILKFPCEDFDFLADDDSAGTGVDLLIGNDYYSSFMQDEKKQIGNNLYVINSDFGWILSGSVTEQDQTKRQENILTVATYCECHNSSCPYFTEADLPLRNIDIRFLWLLESIGIIDSPKTTRQEEAVKHYNDTVQYKNGRYQVKWPWVEYPPCLPDNFGLAFGRLKSQVNRCNMETLQEYDGILKKQLEDNIIEVVEPHNANSEHPLHYLPHHMVKQKGKQGRIVYDASAKMNGQKSLNECLYSGPSMLEDSTALLLKFRTAKVGLSADVEKAFLQVGLHEEDRDVTRFLWLKDITKGVEKENILYLRFCRVPFGIISSPFLLTATIRHHMSQSNKNLLKTVADRCYVDNLVTGVNSIKEAQDIYRETSQAFCQLSMNIRDWISNNKEFLSSVPIKQQAKQTDNTKILGLQWNTDKDTLKLKVGDENFNPEIPVNTKRRVLRTLARVYDPLGFVCPLILSMKLIFQNICQKKLKWDAKLPEDVMRSLKIILHNLKAVKEVEIPRYVGLPSMDTDLSYELHCFSDASKNAYAAIVYLRVMNLKENLVSFIMAKSRVAPNGDKNKLKIPKLELLGFLIASRLLKYVKTNLDLPIQKQYLWTDSLVILGWLRSNKLLPPFVANRVEEIKRNQPQTEMYYINTKLNPADLATRPESWEEKKELWFNGPNFLKQHETYWPKDRFYDTHKTLFSIGEALDWDPGMDEIMELDQLDIPLQENREQEEMQQMPIQEDSNRIMTASTMSGISAYEIKKLQNKHFPDEMAGKKTHLARNLNLFKDVEGILRCRGRMANTTWNYDMKYPLLLPRESEFTNKIITEVHEKNYHVGAAHTLSIIREKYWIPQGKIQVQKMIRKCPQCVKHGGGPYSLPNAPALPAERVNYTTPFTYTGVDYFGPLYVSTPNGKEKRWVALFTCLAVRAIHLEIVKNMTAEECILALRRFAATRNTPKKVYSDNASYFKLISEVLEKPFCIQNSIEWKFIPQLAPWHGGFYERLVAIVKHCLKRTLEKHLLNDSNLLTILKEVEAVVNSRPLTKIETEVTHILRPSDFLSLGKCLTVTPTTSQTICQGSEIKQNLIEGWQKGLKIIEEYKKMFTTQYLSSLRERYRHSPKQPRIKSGRVPYIGDIVQIKSDSKNRENWKVGKIVDLIKGADSECRVAKISVDGNVLTRSVGHLYPLEEESDQPEHHVNVRGDKTANTPAPKSPVYYLDLENLNSLEKENSQSPLDTISTPPTIVVKENTCEEHVPENEERSQGSVTGLTEPWTPRIEMGGYTQGENQIEIRAKRDAAIRAREKILEWTRHLLTILH